MQKSFEVTGPVELEIRLASGDITVDADAYGRGEVELIAHDDESQRARRRCDGRAARARRPGAGDRRRAEQARLQPRPDLRRPGDHRRARCPEESGLSTKTKSADIVAHGVLGGLHVQTASGDVEADGGINVKSASGI